MTETAQAITTTKTPAIIPAFDSWRAELDLVYERKEGKTVLTSKRHAGPLSVQKSFYPENEVCHNYILHPPGGVAGGDQLRLSVDVGSTAHALITTPAANKFYRSQSESSVLEQRLKIEEHSTLEWMPQETILFSGSCVETKTIVKLEKTSRFTGWEITCLGRPACNETFDEGFIRQSFELWQSGKAKFIDRTFIAGGGEILKAKWGLAGYTTMGIMCVTNADNDVLSVARSIEQDAETLSACTLIDDILVVRQLGTQGMKTREYFTRIWQCIRPMVSEREACQPRIWFT